MGEELTTLSVLENQVQLLMILESVEQLDNKRMSVNRFKDLSFGFGLLDELLVDHQRGLLELLLSVEPAGCALLD
jgi:hypothetical protein